MESFHIIKLYNKFYRFSPLAGIKFVESIDQTGVFHPLTIKSFSPLAGIKFVESESLSFNQDV